LTRTAGQSATAPSRDGRCAAPCAALPLGRSAARPLGRLACMPACMPACLLACLPACLLACLPASQPAELFAAAPCQRGRRRRCALVRHEKERWRRDSRFASGPLPDVDAGRGHRRGLDGPTMPKPFQRIRVVFLSTYRRCRDRVGRGSDRRQTGATRAEAPGPPAMPIERGPVASSRRSSKPQSPRNPRRPGRIPTHGKPESGAPAHPVAREAAASAKRKTQRSTRHASSITHHPSPITHHPSPITHHPSRVTRHASRVTHHATRNTQHAALDSSRH